MPAGIAAILPRGPALDHHGGNVPAVREKALRHGPAVSVRGVQLAAERGLARDQIGEGAGRGRAAGVASFWRRQPPDADPHLLAGHVEGVALHDFGNDAARVSDVGPGPDLQNIR